MTAEMAPYLLLGFFVAGLLSTFIPRNVYSRHLAPRTMGSVAKAAALGVPLPLCSCGVIPTAVSLRKEGASHGACTSFLIATPQTGVDSIAATYSLMGLPFAIVRPVAALFTAIFGGWMVNRFAQEDEAVSAKAAQAGTAEECECHCHEHKHGHQHKHECSCHHDEAAHQPSTFIGKMQGALRYGFVEMLQDVGKWLVIGLLIAALITVAVPNEWLAALHDYKLLNMLIVLAVAIPMYVCATGSIPIAVSLMAKGLTPGAALVLLMAGPAVNSASMLVIGKVFGRRTFVLYVASIIIGAMLFGLGIDYLLPQEWFTVAGFGTVAGEHSAHCLTTWDYVFIGAFLLLMANAFLTQHSHHHEVHEEAKEASTPKLYSVKGMSCNHCKANVERAIASIDGVERAEVDLKGECAYVYGKHEHTALIAAVSAIGYTIEEAS
ncbi:MAG: SO_0444 family Cu/Zn efflux transporter [Bacteroidaceae bacterium]|nr:SO_0444 family Cu/Zn efflux transporter [Bacteroidaceae bacterium]